jgi:hypothetical protein
MDYNQVLILALYRCTRASLIGRFNGWTHRWLLDHVLDCFDDVSYLRSLRFLLDHHSEDDVAVVDLLTIHSNL